MAGDVVASLASRKNKLTLKLSDGGGASFVNRHTPSSHHKRYPEVFDETASLPQSPIAPDQSTNDQVSYINFLFSFVR